MPDFAIARKRMVNEQLLRRGIEDPRVLETMARVSRHMFVDEALADQAYGDNPLGIGEGQTISQPYMVALMTQSLKLSGTEKVLEIGTGCGYQTAILAELVRQVYTIERIKTLGLMARSTLKKLGYRNIVIRIGDGSHGWRTPPQESGVAEQILFDGILVAAGSPEIPEPLVAQLSEGGRLVIPIGTEDSQVLMRVTKVNGKSAVENLGACRFVKLVGKFGWHRQKQAGDRFKKRSLV